MRYIGIDLAWGSRATTAAAALAKFQAGPHPSNRRLVGDSQGIVRGERIAELLASRGIAQNPYLETLTRPIRACFEVFPHPAHVALFGLEKTLKSKPGRPLASRIEVFRRYVTLLESLSSADPPLRMAAADAEPGVCDDPIWWRRDPTGMTGAQLKRHEDARDALTCAYVALCHHRWGSERCRIVGDLDTGYIVTPVTPEMAERLTGAELRLGIGENEGAGFSMRILPRRQT